MRSHKNTRTTALSGKAHLSHCHSFAPGVPRGKDLQCAEKGSVCQTRRLHKTESGETHLKAGLPRGLQGMLEGLAKKIVGDGCP